MFQKMCDKKHSGDQPSVMSQGVMKPLSLKSLPGQTLVSLNCAAGLPVRMSEALCVGIFPFFTL